MERIGHSSCLIVDRSLRGFRGCTLIFRENKAAANRKEDPLRKQSPSLVECGKAHAIGMRNNIGHGIHLVAMKDQVLRLIESDDVVTGQLQFFGSTDHGKLGFDFRRIDALRGLTRKAKQDGAVGAMAMTGERQRAV